MSCNVSTGKRGCTLKILLATDGSEDSERAATFLTRFNFSPEDEITVFHAVSWTPIMSEWEYLYEDVKNISYEVAPRILAATSDILSPVDAKIHTLHKEAYPDTAIVTEAADMGADLIVMGAKGARGIESLIVGSVTKHVAIKSPIPVLIVRPPRDSAREKLKILFASDGSAYSEAAGKVLSSIPFPDDTEITVLGVIAKEFEDIPERFALEINDRIKKILAETREKEMKNAYEIIVEACKYLSARYSTINKLTRIGDPSIEILNVAEEVNADIIALGTSGMRGIKGILGSVSRYVLNHCKCSVLIAGKRGS